MGGPPPGTVLSPITPPAGAPPSLAGPPPGTTLTPITSANPTSNEGAKQEVLPSVDKDQPQETTGQKAFRWLDTLDPQLVGALHGAASTVDGLTKIGQAHGLLPTTPGSDLIDKLAARPNANPGETSGDVAENVAEFFSGEELLNMLGDAAKGSKAYKAAGQLSQFLEQYPRVAKLLHLGLASAKQGAISAGQTYAKTGGNSDAALTAGALTAGMSAVVGGTLNATRGAIANRATTLEDVGGVQTPVSAEVRNARPSAAQVAGQEAIGNAAKDTAAQHLEELQESRTAPEGAKALLPASTGPFEFNLRGTPATETTEGESVVPARKRQIGTAEEERPGATNPSRGVPVSDDPLDAVRKAYLAISNGTYDSRVLLKDLRRNLTLPRDAQDAAFFKMIRSGEADFYPEDDPMSRDEEDEQSALHIADRRRHLLYLHRNGSVPGEAEGMQNTKQMTNSENGPEATLLSEVKRLQSGPGNYVRVDHLRKALNDRPELDKTVLRLARAGKLVLGRYEGPRPVPKEWGYIPGEGRDLFMSVALPRDEGARVPVMQSLTGVKPGVQTEEATIGGGGTLKTQDVNVARSHVANLNSAIDSPEFHSYPLEQQQQLLEARADAQKQIVQYHDQVTQHLVGRNALEPIDIPATVRRIGSFGDAADELEKQSQQGWNIVNDATGGRFNAIRQENKDAWNAYAGAHSEEAQKAAERALDESNDKFTSMISGLRGVVDARALDGLDDAYRNAQTLRRVSSAVDGSFAGNASSSARSWEYRGFDGNRLMQSLSTLQQKMGRPALDRVVGRENMDTLFRVAELNRTQAQRAKFGMMAVKPVVENLMHLHVGPIAAGGAAAHAVGLPWEVGAGAGWGVSVASKKVMNAILTNPKIASHLLYAIDQGADPSHYGPMVAEMIQKATTENTKGDEP